MDNAQRRLIADCAIVVLVVLVLATVLATVVVVWAKG
jgi:hypothetical protein